MTQRLKYRPPLAYLVALPAENLLEQSFSPDDNSEYFDEEYGGNL